MQILQKIQDSFPCTYMHVQVSTSYFKMLKQVSLYTKQFPIVRCGQISLLMPKTHSTVQRGSNSLFNETLLFILLLGQLKLSQIYVCLLDFGFIILHVHCINLYK